MLNKTLFLAGSALASAGVYDYKLQGADWPDLHYDDGTVNMCGTPNQSPIDLPTSVKQDKIISQLDDNFNKMYTNQKTDVDVKWTSKTSKIAVNKAGQDKQNLYSWIPTDVYEGSTAPELFNGVQFHFHAGSEHTVGGKRMDLEMHTVHFPENGKGKDPAESSKFIAAALGVMFSVDDYNTDVNSEERAIIDGFFDSLQWDSGSDVKVEEVTYGDLMMMVDTKNRWVYKGSVTTPPCATLVYWNVLRSIYPISQKHLDQFHFQMRRETTEDLEKNHNFREIQEYDEHDLRIVESIKDEKVAQGYMAGFLAAFVSAMILSITAVMAYKEYNEYFNQEVMQKKIQVIRNAHEKKNQVAKTAEEFEMKDIDEDKLELAAVNDDIVDIDNYATGKPLIQNEQADQV